MTNSNQILDTYKKSETARYELRTEKQCLKLYFVCWIPELEEWDQTFVGYVANVSGFMIAVDEIEEEMNAIGLSFK